MQELTISPIFFLMKLYENPALQSEPLSLKQLPVSLFGQARLVEC